MDKRQLFNTLLSQITHIIHGDGTTESKLHAICNLLRDNVPGYDWVGFYLVNPHTDELVLGPFAGKPTIHTRIPFGRGICGRVAHTKQPLIVPDVSKEANYLACDINVRSEAVIPIFLDNNFVAELDIDSHLPSAFTDEDKDFLIKVCELVAPLHYSTYEVEFKWIVTSCISQPSPLGSKTPVSVDTNIHVSPSL